MTDFTAQRRFTTTGHLVRSRSLEHELPLLFGALLMYRLALPQLTSVFGLALLALAIFVLRGQQDLLAYRYLARLAVALALLTGLTYWLLPHAERRLPALLDLPVQSTWWGYYEVSPDHNAIVGEAEEPSRFLYATGFSGHGFQQAPAVGEHVAELVVGRQPTLDLSAFSVDRFAAGAERPEAFVV